MGLKMEVIIKQTGEILDGDSRFLICQISKSGLPVFLGNKTKTIKRFTKEVNDSIWFLDKNYAENVAKRFKYGKIKVVTLTEALRLEKEGEPSSRLSSAEWAHIPRFGMKEY